MFLFPNVTTLYFSLSYHLLLCRPPPLLSYFPLLVVVHTLYSLRDEIDFNILTTDLNFIELKISQNSVLFVGFDIIFIVM